MILKVLVINEQKKDLSGLVKYFEEDFCEVTEVFSIEDSLGVAGHKKVDLVLLLLSDYTSIYVDFLAILRTTLGISPLIGIADLCSCEDFPGFMKSGVDSIVYSDISKEDLWRTITALSNTKEKICRSLTFNENLGEQTNKRVTIFSDYEFPLFDSSFLNTGTVISFYKTKDNQIDYSNEDVFIIDVRLNNIGKLCADLKLTHELHYKPIFLLTDKTNKPKAIDLFNRNIGIMDIIEKETHPAIISCRMNAYIKYKRLLDKFYSDVKANIYKSSVDSLTTVYNRSFLDDYINKKENALHYSAVLMLDVDKFKEINDEHGHAFADQVLNELITYVKSFIRLTDFIAVMEAMNL